MTQRPDQAKTKELSKLLAEVRKPRVKPSVRRRTKGAEYATMVDAGMSASAVARRFGVSVNTVYSAVARHRCGGSRPQDLAQVRNYDARKLQEKRDATPKLKELPTE